MLIGFTDDSLAGIIANILADVANAWYRIWEIERERERDRRIGDCYKFKI